MFKTLEELNAALARSWRSEAHRASIERFHILAETNETIAARYEAGGYPPPASGYMNVSAAADERRYLMNC